MGLFSKKTKEEKEKERRKKLLEALNKFKYIGTLVNPDYEDYDLDYLYENCWELIGAYDDAHYGTRVMYFKKIKATKGGE